MSQAQKEQEVREDITYVVKASYYVMDIDDKGRSIETKMPDQNIRLYKLMRRNVRHSALAKKVLMGVDASNENELAVEFIECCVVDEKVKENLTGDILACVEIFLNKIVLEDFNRFFEDWDFYRKLVESRHSGKK